MKLISKIEFVKAAGTPLFHNRDFSIYDGASYECACGSAHYFSQYSCQHYGSTGASAKFVVACPENSNTLTLIKTKNKFIILFDHFISLAGCIDA